MDKYIVTGMFARLSSGKLELTEKQAKLRSQNLERTDQDSVFNIVRPVDFKRGEVIGYDGAFPKAMAEVMEKEEPIKPAKPEKPAKEIKPAEVAE